MLYVRDCAKLLIDIEYLCLQVRSEEVLTHPFTPLQQFRAILPPEEDLQTYKRSLVRFRNIMLLVLELIADKLQHPAPKLSLEGYWVNNNNNIYLSRVLEKKALQPTVPAPFKMNIEERLESRNKIVKV